MGFYSKIRNVFDKEGKIFQLECGLEAVSNSVPMVVIKNNDIIVCAAKKRIKDKLCESNDSCFKQIHKNVFSGLTGPPQDVNIAIIEAKELASEITYNQERPVTADILCREFADKIQPLIQSTGKRFLAFGGAFFGFDGNKPVVYMTDLSAICYPCFAVTYGQNSGKMSKLITKSYREDIGEAELFELCLSSILESTGVDSDWSEIEIAYIKKDNAIQYLTDQQVDHILQTIAEK